MYSVLGRDGTDLDHPGAQTPPNAGQAWVGGTMPQALSRVRRAASWLVVRMRSYASAGCVSRTMVRLSRVSCQSSGAGAAVLVHGAGGAGGAGGASGVG